MKKVLMTLALVSFLGGAAFAHEGGDKDKKAKKGDKKECTTAEKSHCAEMGATGSAMPACCAKKGKTASLMTPAKPDEAKKETKTL